MGFGLVSIVIAVIMLLLMPLVYAGVMQTALLKLQLSSDAATLIIIGILGGSMINIPLKRIPREEMVPTDLLAVFGLGGRWSGMKRLSTDTVVAVNVGGCLVPSGLAAYEIVQLVTIGSAAPLIGAVLLNVIVCYVLARSVPGVGIVMPGLVPPAVAAMSAFWLAPGHATPVAYVAGTLGPLIGADLLHLRHVERMHAGVVSIGGAGTFDGILLSGIVASYLS